MGRAAAHTRAHRANRGAGAGGDRPEAGGRLRPDGRHPAGGHLRCRPRYSRGVGAQRRPGARGLRCAHLQRAGAFPASRRSHSSFASGAHEGGALVVARAGGAPRHHDSGRRYQFLVRHAAGGRPAGSVRVVRARPSPDYCAPAARRTRAGHRPRRGCRRCGGRRVFDHHARYRAGGCRETGGGPASRAHHRHPAAPSRWRYARHRGARRSRGLAGHRHCGGRAAAQRAGALWRSTLSRCGRRARRRRRRRGFRMVRCRRAGRSGERAPARSASRAGERQ